MPFPFFKQPDQMDCGPTCLKMVAKYYGQNFALNELRDKSFITHEGVSLQGISHAAESIGFRTAGVRLSFDKLREEVPLPCIIHWNQGHFVVVYKVKKNKVFVADPDSGLITYNKNEFLKSWTDSESEENNEGIALLLEPTPSFFELNLAQDENVKNGITYLLNYIGRYKKSVFNLFLALLAASALQMILPFLTQSIVDVGIKTKNISFIYLILIGQLVLVVGRTIAEFIKGWILMNLSTKINLSIISDFLNKLMQLPMSFFDTKKTGDILQRIEDHNRVERFLNSSSLSIFFSFLNLVVFGAILFFYSVLIFVTFFIGSLIYVLYVTFFLKVRKELDIKRFNELARNRSNLIQIVGGIHEIKLNTCKHRKRLEWEGIQSKLYQLSLKSIRVQQWQDGGGTLINEIKNVLITFIAAMAVIDNQISLGMMLAVQYIIGILNVPILEFVNFSREFQDARISLDRIGEIHSLRNEEAQDSSALNHTHEPQSIFFRDVSFQYEGPMSPKALNQVNLAIDHGKVTAIVGTSGSGKTTLLKLILKYYAPTEGVISLGNEDILARSPRNWRGQCGVVMQEGFLFSDTIVNNICISSDNVDQEKLHHAVTVANILSFIESLPLGYNTQIGQDGMSISTGQKQRILIARAVYKNPDYLFFDEATSALDANNELVIMDNLNKIFNGKTVVIIAHRLSTVKNADKIIVLDEGKVIEVGNHVELSQKKGKYFNLIKNQLELGE